LRAVFGDKGIGDVIRKCAVNWSGPEIDCPIEITRRNYIAGMVGCNAGHNRIAVLIEHCAGNFPLWLAPEQFAVLPISEKFNDYAQSVVDKLKEIDIRGFLDDRDEKIGRKIRDAEVKKVPFMLIVGEKEVADGKVSVRKHSEGDKGAMALTEFVEQFKTDFSMPK